MADPFAEWQINERDYPQHGTPEERLRFLLGYAILAPSGHNTQPWLFQLRPDGVDLIADRTRCLPVVDPFDRALVISCGAALGHLCTAMRFYGVEPDVRLLPDALDADLLAHVAFGADVRPSSRDVARFRAITRRRTTRKHYPEEPLPDGLAQALHADAAAEGCELAIVSDLEQRRAIAALVAEGDRAQFRNPAFRRELASWVHSRRASSRDGMSGAAFGMPDVLSAVGGLVIRTFDMGDRQGATDEAIATGSPALLVLGTRADDPRAWLAAGMALSSILLDVTAAGWTSAYLNQPVETDALRPRLGEAAGIAGHPQLLFRIGRAEPGEPAVRRPVHEVLHEPAQV
ncbi:Acg family FMN-binding oxidoreductase [Thermaurantiacus sp.]